MNVDLRSAIGIVKNGGILIFPTDTAFGIGCRIDNEASLRRLYEIRKRPQNKAVPVLFESIEQVKEYILPFDKKVESLMHKHWPGALTIVLKCKTDRVPGLVRGGGDTLGVRIPDYDLVLELIRMVGVPIVGTSANTSGGQTPFSLEELDRSLVNQVDGALIEKPVQGDALNKANAKKQVSTVIDCTQIPWKILRQGAVNISL